MKGVVCIEMIRVSDGEVVDRIETHNLVVTAGYDELIKILGADDPTEHYVERMQFGTGNAAPVAGDTTLTMPITPIKDIASITYPDGTLPFRVIVEAFLLAGEGNGFAISEAGLLTADSVLAARTTFGARVKDGNHILRGTWQISN